MLPGLVTHPSVSGFNQLAENYDSWVQIITSVGEPLDQLNGDTQRTELTDHPNFYHGVTDSNEFRKCIKDANTRGCENCISSSAQIANLQQMLVETVAQVNDLQDIIALVCVMLQCACKCTFSCMNAFPVCLASEASVRSIERLGRLGRLHRAGGRLCRFGRSSRFHRSVPEVVSVHVIESRGFCIPP